MKGLGDRAIPVTLLYHGIRSEERCKLRVRDYQRQEGILHFRIEGKGDKMCFIPVGIEVQRLIHAYLGTSGHEQDVEGPLFRLVKNNAPASFESLSIRVRSTTISSGATEKRWASPSTC